MTHKRLFRHFSLWSALALMACSTPKIGQGLRMIDAGNAAAQFPMHGYEAPFRAMEMSLATQISNLTNGEISVLRPEFLRDIYTDLEMKQPALFVSVVFPLQEHSEPGGIVLVTNKGDLKSQRLARALARHLEQQIPLSVTTQHEAQRPLLKTAGGPAITIEIGNFTNPQQAAWLSSEKERLKLAQAIASFMLRP